MKELVGIVKSPARHWVGDGFPVQTVFSPEGGRSTLGPFVMMDYAQPTRFEPSTTPRGVDTHPHKGFETVTLVFQGELEHRDSAGNSGSIGPGDVQWMTAGSGVLHEEKHSKAFTQSGGMFEVAQIWVNLPARHKSAPPAYQTILRDAIPTAELPDGAGKVRLIAGSFDGISGAAKTFTPVTVWDVRLAAGGSATLPVVDGHVAGLYVRSGSIEIGGEELRASELAILTTEGAGVQVATPGGAEFLVLAGEPIDEPLVAYGPFVMNTQDEIMEAIAEFRSGKFGRID